MTFEKGQRVIYSPALLKRGFKQSEKQATVIREILDRVRIICDGEKYPRIVKKKYVKQLQSSSV
jgi:hypothetical protein